MILLSIIFFLICPLRLAFEVTLYSLFGAHLSIIMFVIYVIIQIL